MSRATWCESGALSLAIFLVGCALSPSLPSPEPQQWRYPNLSADNCPDLSGTYEGWSVTGYLSIPSPGIFAKTKVTVSGRIIYVSGINIEDRSEWFTSEGQPIKVKKREFARGQAEMIKLDRTVTERSVNHYWESGFSVRGCSDGRYVVQSVHYEKFGGGESPAKNTVAQNETIIERQANGDLKVTYVSDSASRDSFGVEHAGSELITTKIIKRVDD